MTTPQDEMRHPDSQRCIDARNALNAAIHGDGAVIDDLESAVAYACSRIKHEAAQAETLAAVTRERDALREDAARLDALAQPGWELSMNNDSEAMDDELWQVHRVSGGRNDREWRLIGQGVSPREAIDAARATLTPTAPGAQEQA